MPNEFKTGMEILKLEKLKEAMWKYWIVYLKDNPFDVNFFKEAIEEARDEKELEQLRIDLSIPETFEDLRSIMESEDEHEKLLNELRKSNLKGKMVLCPFHDDNDPSLKIYEDTHSFYCFGCHAFGNNLDVLDNPKEALSKETKGGTFYYLPKGESNFIEEEPEEDHSKRLKDFKLHYKTEHLPYFSDLNSIIGIQGRVYSVLNKLLWYQLMGIVIKNKKIKYAQIKTDTRLSILFPIASGRGKLHYNYASKLSLNDRFKVDEPTTYHEEQFIGKVVTRKIQKQGEKKIKKLGYFGSDLIQINEGNKLIFSPKEDVESIRKNLSIALDPIGYNLVTKFLIDDLEGCYEGVNATFDEKINYYPECSCQIFFQPIKKIPEEIIRQGFLRRTFCPYIDISKLKPNYDSKLEAKEDNKDSIIRWKTYLNSINDMDFKDFSLTDEAINTLKKCTKFLIFEGRKFGKKGSNYMEIWDFTLQQLLLRLSVILARSRCQNEIDETIVSLAFIDLREFMLHHLEFIELMVIGDLSSIDRWEGAEGWYKRALEYLYNEGAISEESSNVTIEDFLQELMRIRGFQHSTARSHYYKMKKQFKWISGRQTDKYDSRVWLNFTPKVTEIIDEGDEDVKGAMLYNTIIEGYKSLLNKLSPLLPLAPLRQEEVE